MDVFLITRRGLAHVQHIWLWKYSTDRCSYCILFIIIIIIKWARQGHLKKE